MFFHQVRRGAFFVHGDNFTVSGPKPQLDRLQTSVAKENEISIGPRLGPGELDAKEGNALNLVIRWCDKHIEYEADPRQVERLVAECGLEGAKGIATPSVKATFQELEEDADLLRTLHTAFRGAAARGNYMAANWVDAQFACKAICKYMENTSPHAWRALKRLCTYFSSAPGVIYDLHQQSVQCIDVDVPRLANRLLVSWSC